MESLKRNLERLSQEEQKKVEDFANFLLQRRKTHHPLQSTSVSPALPPQVRAPPPTVQEPSIATEPVRVYSLIHEGDAAPQAPRKIPLHFICRRSRLTTDSTLTTWTMGSSTSPRSHLPLAPDPRRKRCSG